MIGNDLVTTLDGDSDMVPCGKWVGGTREIGMSRDRESSLGSAVPVRDGGRA